MVPGEGCAGGSFSVLSSSGRLCSTCWVAEGVAVAVAVAVAVVVAVGERPPSPRP